MQALNLGESEASEELPSLGASISAEVHNLGHDVRCEM